MDFSERNRKVAIARWKRVHSEEKNNILKDKGAKLMKSALCGFLAGDGSVQKRKEKEFYHYQIDFYPDDRLMKDTYIDYMEKLYSKKPKVTKDYKFYNVRISSKTIYDDILKECCFGLKSWNLPNKLFSVKGSKENWLRAFFSAEAYVNQKSIKLQTINIKGMKEVANLLKELGIGNNYYEYDSKKGNESRVGIVFINRKEDRMKFLDNVGFWHDKKTRILKKSLDL